MSEPSNAGGQRGGHGRFTAQTTLREALTADPSLDMVLTRNFQLGGDNHVAFDPHDTIARIAALRGIPTDRLLAALNREA